MNNIAEMVPKLKNQVGTTLKVNATINTGGTGYWSTAKKSVDITALTLDYINEDQTFGSLNVYFDTATWAVDELGLIYSDARWIHELRIHLDSLGLNTAGVSYSEQGLQGSNYVNLDVDGFFMSSFAKLVA
jgi:hypothetical protein